MGDIRRMLREQDDRLDRIQVIVNNMAKALAQKPIFDWRDVISYAAIGLIAGILIAWLLL
jgi:hypothetical protein